MIEIPNYTIESELGLGGMATVYLATQDMLSRHVALKVMLPEMARDESFRKSFLSEGKIIANLEHTNIVRVHDVGVIDDSILYMAMENLSGGTLKEKLTDRSLSYAESLRILDQVAAGLSYAHDKGYIHRDVKPGNILFRENGTAVLTDFGIAKLQDTSGELTRMGYTMGTVQYMSPEQAVTTDLDHRSDIYSLGLVFYEMLTGQKAFKAESTIQAIHQHTTVAPPELPEKYGFLQGTIDRVLAKEPADRYQTINEFIVAVKTAADVDKTVVRKLPVSNDLDDKTQVLRLKSNKPKKKRTGLILGVVGGVTLFGALLFGAMKNPDLVSWFDRSEEKSLISKSKETAKKDDLISRNDKAKKKEAEELQRISETKKKDEIKLQAKLEAQKRSVEIKKQEAERLSEVKKQDEEKRLAEAKKQKEKELAKEKKQEEQKQEEQKRLAEAKKREEERLVEAEKQEEEKRLIEVKKKEEEKRLAEEEKEKRLAEVKKEQEKERRLIEVKKQEEEKRLAEEERKQNDKKRLAEKQKKLEAERKRLEEKSKKKEQLAKQLKIKKEKALAKKKAAEKKKLIAKRKAQQKRKQLAALKAKRIAEENRRKQQLAKAKGHIKVSATLNGRPLKTSFVLIKGGKRVQTISGRAQANFTIPPGRYTLKTQYGGQVGSAIVNITAYETAIQKFAFRGRAPAKKVPPRKAPPLKKKEEWLHTHGSDGYHDPLQDDPLQ